MAKTKRKIKPVPDGILDTINNRVSKKSEYSTANSGRLGRRRGKRSNPDYEQVTCYIRKQTHKHVKIALLRSGKGKEFSELVEDLLFDWLKFKS